MYGILETMTGKQKVYDKAAEYGIVCNVQDLNTIVGRLDKYLKKTKVRSAGLSKQFGYSHWQRGSGIESWYEWWMYAGNTKGLTDEQGRSWHFELKPNRHFHIAHQEGDIAKEVYSFSERKDLVYHLILIQHMWFYEEKGQMIYADSEDARKKRELFFQGLLECIGFPLETLHVYEKEEERIFR